MTTRPQPPSEVEVVAGQVWASRDGKRMIGIISVEPKWMDVRYRNLATGRIGEIFASNLQAKYDLIAPAGEDHGATP